MRKIPQMQNKNIKIKKKEVDISCVESMEENLEKSERMQE